MVKIFFVLLFSVHGAEITITSLLERFKNPVAVEFPKFSKTEIVQLLKLAADESIAYQCPSNPISSRRDLGCTTGMVALWVIEGIRQGKYPSLNPVLIDTESKIKDDKLLLRAARKKYEAWWSNGGKGEPLKGSNIGWY